MLEIKKILDKSVNAPSGDNGQPWEFYINNNVVYIKLIKSADTNLYNLNQKGSYFSHGALIFNIKIVSKQMGYNIKIDYFPKKPNMDITTKIVFEKTNNSKVNELYKYIDKRCTNRKLYKKVKIENSVVQSLTDIINSYPGVRINLIHDLINNPDLIRVLTYNDRLLFQNKYIHESIFRMINWTKEEEDQRKRGLYVKAMELNPEQILAFRKFSGWKMMSFLNKLGIPRIISQQNKRIYQASSAIGLISIKNNEPLSFLKAGEAFEEFWLSSVKYGLSLQPVTGIGYLINLLKDNEINLMSDDDIEIIEDAKIKFSKIFPELNTRYVAMIFRIGFSEPPSAVSKKLPAIIKNYV